MNSRHATNLVQNEELFQRGKDGLAVSALSYYSFKPSLKTNFALYKRTGHLMTYYLDAVCLSLSKFKLTSLMQIGTYDVPTTCLLACLFISLNLILESLTPVFVATEFSLDYLQCDQMVE